MSRALAALCVVVATAISSFASAEPLKVAISQRGFWDSSFVEFAEAAGFFKEANLEVEPFYTDGGAATLTTVLSGSADIGLSNGLLGVIGIHMMGGRNKCINRFHTRDYISHRLKYVQKETAASLAWGGHANRRRRLDT